MSDDIVFSNSKLNTYRRCPRKYRFRYIEGLEAKERKVQLERGTWLHSLLQTYYNGEDWIAKHKELKKVFYNLFEEEREELGDMDVDCLRIMRAYLRTYHDDLSRYVVVDTELDETVTLPNGVKMRIIVDLIFEDRRTGLLFAWDHKSRKSFEDGDNMLLDPQLTRYYYGLGVLGYKPLGGVGYNELRTKPPTVPKQLQSGGLSKAMKIDTDVYTYMREIRRLGLDPNNYTEILRHIARNQTERFFRRTIMPKDKPMIQTMMREVRQTAEEIYAAERRDRFPRTFDKSCSWGCDFTNLCIADLHGADYSPIVKMSFTTREQRERLKKIEAIKAKRMKRNG